MTKVKPAPETPVVAKICGLAIASLVLGAFGFCTFGLSGIAGFILGIIALSLIKKSAGRLTGQPLAITGIIISMASIIILPIFILMSVLLPALIGSRQKARAIISMNNAKQLCVAMHLYCDNNDGRLPPVDRWTHLILPYIGNNRAILPVSPSRNDQRPWAMNVQLEGKKINEISNPQRTVLIFESTFPNPPAGGPEMLPGKPSAQGYLIGFVDGHIECVRPEHLRKLIWIPARRTLTPPNIRKRNALPPIKIHPLFIESPSPFL